MKRVVCLVTFLALSVAVSHVHAQAIGDPQEGLTGCSRYPKSDGSYSRAGVGTGSLRAHVSEPVRIATASRSVAPRRSACFSREVFLRNSTPSW
jgi:hypothetical protein